MNYRDVLGLTDLEITTKCKLLVGDENHTFGEVCSNSDLVVLKNLKKERFLEWGLINGKEFYLEVYKAPLFNDKLAKEQTHCWYPVQITLNQ